MNEYLLHGFHHILISFCILHSELHERVIVVWDCDIACDV